MSRLSLLLLIALLAAGCGEKQHHQTEAERAKMEGEFSQVAINIANATVTTGPADETTMEQFTNDYIKLDAQVRRRPRARRGQEAPRGRGLPGPAVVPAVRRAPPSRAREVLISREGT